MRIVRVREFGPPQVMRIEEADSPTPSAGQVLVQVELAGAIYAETIVRSGRYPFPLPYEPGIEIGGRVVEVGPDTDGSLLGRQVVATTSGNTGGYAELALAETRDVHPIPKGLALEHAIPVFQAGAVGIGLLSAMRVTAGETVLITAAAGRIGSLLVQLAKTLGARVIAAASGPEKLAAASDLGADDIVDYRAADWAGQVKDATGGRGACVVLDAVGGSLGEQAMHATANGGRFGVYGFASGDWIPLDARQIAERGPTITGPLGIVFAKTATEQRADVEQALAATATGLLRPHIHATFPLEQAADAHVELEQRRTIGALLLTP